MRTAVTFAVRLHDGWAGIIHAHSFDQWGKFLRFYWLDEDGGRRDVALVDTAFVVAVAPVVGT